MATQQQRRLALALLPGLGAARHKTLHQLLVATNDGDALTCDAVVAAGFTSALWHDLQLVLQDKTPVAVSTQCDQCLEWAQHGGHHLLTLASPQYPPLLYEIPDPPPLLFVRGQVDVLALPQLGIVGSRSPTADGRKNARNFAAKLAGAGYLITSGLALGIDGESHSGALAGGGRTVAVLGTGLDRMYPRKHAALAEQIIEHGALVSEFLPGTDAYPGNFPQRNRIISGLAHGVLVVEAATQSGSLITARLAAEQGREVFVLPGSIHNPMARGCHQLIRQGAKLVETVSDILEELPALLDWERERVLEDAAVNASADHRPGLTAATRRVLAQIAYDPVPVDALVQQSALDVATLYTHLMTLELAGLITKRAGGYVLSTP
jgi:DNA processing protein